MLPHLPKNVEVLTPRMLQCHLLRCRWLRCSHCMGWYYYKKGQSGDRHPQRECHVKMKTEIRMMSLHSMECQRSPVNHQILPYYPQKEPSLPYLDLGFLAFSTGRINVCYLCHQLEGCYSSPRDE